MRNDTKELKAMQLIADELPVGEHIDDAVKVIDDYLESSQSVLAQREYFQNKVKELLEENLDMREETYFEKIRLEEQIATLKSKLSDTSYDYHSIRTALTAKINTLNAKLADEKKRRLTVEENMKNCNIKVSEYKNVEKRLLKQVGHLVKGTEKIEKLQKELDDTRTRSNFANDELRDLVDEERRIANQAKEIAEQAKKENLELRKRLAKKHENEQETVPSLWGKISKLHEEILELKNKLKHAQCGSCDRKGGCDEPE